MNTVQIIPITGLPIIKEGDDISGLICQAAEKQGTPIEDHDVIVVTHVVVSRAEGNVVDVDSVTPSEYAKKIANVTQKDPKMVEVILSESKKVVRTSKGKMITQTKHGIVCANSGIDQSNVAGNSTVALLPKDSNQSAKNIRDGIRKNCGKDVAVIVSDTHGRPFRRGEINIALGTCGFEPLRDRRGEKDLFGYTIRLKRTAIADELASAAELVIGQTNEGIPAAIIKGYNYPKSETADANTMLRSAKEDLFI